MFNAMKLGHEEYLAYEELVMRLLLAAVGAGIAAEFAPSHIVRQVEEIAGEHVERMSNRERDYLALNLPTNFPLTEPEKVLVGQHKKIQAIKALRDRTGLGLKEAKDVVDAFDASPVGRDYARRFGMF